MTRTGGLMVTSGGVIGGKALIMVPFAGDHSA